MRAPPSVGVCGSGGAAWRTVQAGLPAFACSVLLGWLGAHAGWPVTVWAPVGAALGGLVCSFTWRRTASAPVELAWDGRRWAAGGLPGRLDVMIDLGGWLLLRLRPDAPGAECWIAIAEREAGTAWHALRAAVYSRPSEPTHRVLIAERAAD